MKQLSKMQGEWLKYKQMRDSLTYFGAHISDESNSWGPHPKSEIHHTLLTFFNVIWDFENESHEFDVLELTERKIHIIAKNMDEFCSEENPDRYKETYDFLMSEAKYFKLI